MAETPSLLLISSIICDAGTQSRKFVSEPTVIDYADDIKSGANFPPIVVFTDGSEYWVADGFHRIAATIRAGKKKIAAIVKNGSIRDAILYSVGCNGQHGLKRSNADKRKAVNLLLRDDEWAAKSDRWIAETCGVSRTIVENVRNSAGGVNATCRKGKDGKTYKQPKRRKRSVPKHVPPVDEDGDEKDEDLIEAGFRKVATPVEVVRRELRKATDSELNEIRELVLSFGKRGQG